MVELVESSGDGDKRYKDSGAIIHTLRPGFARRLHNERLRTCDCVSMLGATVC
jgi:hypothetical protein